MPQHAIGCFAQAAPVPYLVCVHNFTVEHIRAAVASHARQAVNTADGPALIPAAVLVPVVCVPDGLCILLTRRTETVETHKGQIAFPGGMVDETDRDRVHTAVREAEEELGIPQSMVEPIGMLDDLPTPTGFCITPVVGLLPSLPPLHLSPGEVAEAFTVPLAFLADPANAVVERRAFRGVSREVWSYRFGDRVIWGATGTVIHRFMETLRGS
jgi:8-oxo-dGTP pyrophosphatase MutT (NUDIX family)